MPTIVAPDALTFLEGPTVGEDGGVRSFQLEPGETHEFAVRATSSGLPVAGWPVEFVVDHVVERQGVTVGRVEESLGAAVTDEEGFARISWKADLNQPHGANAPKIIAESEGESGTTIRGEVVVSTYFIVADIFGTNRSTSAGGDTVATISKADYDPECPQCWWAGNTVSVLLISDRGTTLREVVGLPSDFVPSISARTFTTRSNDSEPLGVMVSEWSRDNRSRISFGVILTSLFDDEPGTYWVHLKMAGLGVGSERSVTKWIRVELTN